MIHQFQLSPIEANTKGAVKRLRKTGFIPVSLQSKGMTTLHFQQETQPLADFLRHYGEGTLLDLLIAPDNRRQRAIVQSLQRDPLTQKLTQVTFRQLSQGDILRTHVALAFVGEPVDVRHGDAMVQHQLDRLEIECSQDNLPSQITVPIGDLQPGDVVRVSDLPVDPRYKILTPPDAVLASLTSTRAAVSGREAEEDAAAAAAAAASESV
jgi:large subunit ribosomal protein L25